MRFALVALAGLLLVAFSLERGSQVAATGSDEEILEFDTMVGVSGPFVGSAANAIRGIAGAGAAWRIDRGRGELGTDGSLEVDVEGLVLVNTGANPQPAFRAAVSCLTTSGGAVVTVNKITDPFPATSTGDATTEAAVDLPSPCVAPIIFVGTGSGTFRWFSVTGF